ncbi:unnamed protein product [Effrenium voratum]|uniref:Uncharacterized protein n=1 Tax=Effrenium voratum TaxID=2562239 RepID=A0AA36NG03_9DINO|nr:unnamed protein product [Effrenium voratum]
MTEDEFAAWWGQHHQQGGSFIDALRRTLAIRLRVKNFRQLALVCGQDKLSPESLWIDTELVVMIQAYPQSGNEELVWAAGDVAHVVHLLERPLDPDFKYLGSTALHLAVRDGHLEVVRCLLEAGADPDSRNHTGMTPMHMAGKYGGTKIMHCLLEARADKHVPNNAGKTPMDLAREYGKTEVLCLLSEAR